MGGGFSIFGDNSPITISLQANAGGSEYWNYCPEAGVVEITIRYGSVIDSIEFKHANENSTAPKYGGEGGNKRETFKINWPHEYVTRITGNTVVYNEARVVGNLTFYTNLSGEHAIDGSCKDNVKTFEFSEKDRAIVGLYGTKGTYIKSIGVHYDDLPASIVNTKVISTITMEKDIPREVGPWGGNKGKAWDDGRLQGRISGIDVHVRNGVIQAIHYRYQQSTDDSSPGDKKHGGEGATIYRIELDTEEYLVGMSGFYGAFDGKCCVENVEYQVVRSISFYTNKGKYGSFGTEIGTFFNSPVCTNAKVVGFHGRSGEYLDAIGVHVQYLPSSITTDINHKFRNRLIHLSAV